MARDEGHQADGAGQDAEEEGDHRGISRCSALRRTISIRAPVIRMHYGS